MALSDLTPGIPPTRTFVCVGHGSLSTITDKDRMRFVVPEGVEIAFWVYHGETAASSAIETYRQNITAVDARMMRGRNADLEGHEPRPNHERRLAGRLAPEALQSLHVAHSAAAAAAPPPPAAAATSTLSPTHNRRHAFAPGQLTAAAVQHNQALQQRTQQAQAAGELAVMREELTTNRGILLPATTFDVRSPRLTGLPQVIKAGGECYNYRLTYDPRLCDDYITGGKNTINEGPLPAFLVPDHRVNPAQPIEERGRLLETFARLVSQRARGSVIHWAACRAVIER